jgi:hypothetical protein
LSACGACSAGSFSAVNGAMECTACAPGGYQALTGTSLCSPCQAGTYGTASGYNSSGQCTNCAAGTWSAGTGQNAPSTCTSCLKGSYSPTVAATLSGTCMPCPAGNFSAADGSTNCTQCAKGSYQALAGKAECTVCPAGSKGVVTGATTVLVGCAQCSPGTYGSGGTDNACVGCPANSSSGVGATQCTANQGYYYDSAAAAPVNLINSCGADGRQACPTFTSHASFGDSKSDCWIGYDMGKDVTLTGGTLTVAAEYESDFQVVIWGVNNYKKASGTQLTLQSGCKEANNYGVGYSKFIFLCTDNVVGQYVYFGSLMPSRFVNFDLFLTTTEVSGGGSNTAYKQCPLNSACPLTTQCTTSGTGVCCGDGTYWLPSATAEAGCTMCAVGLFGDGSETTCHDYCPTGRYKDTAAGTCPACGAGKYRTQTQGVGEAACTSCGVGLFSTTVRATTSSVCTPCGVGEYQDATGSEACSPCPAGTYGVGVGFNSSGQCTRCVAGTWSAATGQSSNATCNGCLPGGILGEFRGTGVQRVRVLRRGEVLAECGGVCVCAVRGRVFSGSNRAERVQRVPCGEKRHRQGHSVRGLGVHALPGGDVQRWVRQQCVQRVPEQQRVAGGGGEVHAGAGVLHAEEHEGHFL